MVPPSILSLFFSPRFRIPSPHISPPSSLLSFPSWGMEKCRSLPDSSSSYYSSVSGGGFGHENLSNSYSFNGPSGKGEGFASAADPELKRKRRIASYNSFAVERKLKSSLSNSFKWIKNKFADSRYGV